MSANLTLGGANHYNAETGTYNIDLTEDELHAVFAIRKEREERAKRIEQLVMDAVSAAVPHNTGDWRDWPGTCRIARRVISALTDAGHIKL